MTPEDKNPVSANSVHSPRTIRRNIAWSAVNHFFVEGGMTLSDPATVLPLMIREMGGSHVLAGLVPSVRLFGWLLPQFFVAAPLQRLRRFLPTVRLLEIVRALGIRPPGGTAGDLRSSTCRRHAAHLFRALCDHPHGRW